MTKRTLIKRNDGQVKRKQKILINKTTLCSSYFSELQLERLKVNRLMYPDIPELIKSRKSFMFRHEKKN